MPPRQNAVARDDNRIGVFAERPADGAHRAPVADRRGDLAIGERLSRRDPPRHVIDALVERRDVVGIERNAGQIVIRAFEQVDDRRDRLGDEFGRLDRAGFPESGGLTRPAFRRRSSLETADR